MLEKLKLAEQKYEAIEAELATPEVFSNPELYAAKMKEYNNVYFWQECSEAGIHLLRKYLKKKKKAFWNVIC